MGAIGAPENRVFFIPGCTVLVLILISLWVKEISDSNKKP